MIKTRRNVGFILIGLAKTIGSIGRAVLPADVRPTIVVPVYLDGDLIVEQVVRHR